MITEDYVSFEIAKLLKEKGFCENTEHEIWYVIKQFSTGCLWNSCTYKVGDITREYNDDCCIPMPTLQMAMKWLRIEHNINVEPHIVRTKFSYGYMPNYVDLKELKQHFPFDEFDFSNADQYACITYDKACETTIKYCLENLI